MVNGRDGIKKKIRALEKDINDQVAANWQLLKDMGTSSAMRHSVYRMQKEAEKRKKEIVLYIERMDVLALKISDTQSKTIKWKKSYGGTALSGITHIDCQIDTSYFWKNTYSASEKMTLG